MPLKPTVILRSPQDDDNPTYGQNMNSPEYRNGQLQKDIESDRKLLKSFEFEKKKGELHSEKCAINTEDSMKQVYINSKNEQQHLYNNAESDKTMAKVLNIPEMESEATNRASIAQYKMASLQDSIARVDSSLEKHRENIEILTEIINNFW